MIRIKAWRLPRFFYLKKTNLVKMIYSTFFDKNNLTAMIFFTIVYPSLQSEFISLSSRRNDFTFDL